MTDIIIRETKESDLLTIKQLTLELIEVMGDTEGSLFPFFFYALFYCILVSIQSSPA